MDVHHLCMAALSSVMRMAMHQLQGADQYLWGMGQRNAQSYRQRLIPAMTVPTTGFNLDPIRTYIVKGPP